MASDELWGTCEHHAPNTRPGDCENGDCHIDPLVYEIVMALWEAGVRTHTSCQGGGPPHALMTRTVRLGPACEEGDGERAFTIARELGMPVFAVARVTTDDKFWYELWFGQEPWSRNRAGSSMAEREPHKLGNDGSTPSRPTKRNDRAEAHKEEA